MSPDLAHDKLDAASSAVIWFAAEHPTEGGTVFVTHTDGDHRDEDDAGPDGR
jgi:hypothetical protein